MSQTIAGQWLQQGKHQGELNEARRALRQVLAARNFDISEELSRQIDACADLAWLRQAHDRAVVVASISELGSPPSSP